MRDNHQIEAMYYLSPLQEGLLFHRMADAAADPYLYQYAYRLHGHLRLDAFERAIMADPEALGVFYFGSLGRGTATRYSDLDIFVVVPDAIAEPYQTKLVPLLQLFGEVHWLDIPNGKGFVGPGWNQVDIEMARLAAEIQLRSQQYAKRPKRKFVSASTKEYAWAEYLRGWVDRVERVGNLNYPDEARRRRIGGLVVISVAVRRDGSSISRTRAPLASGSYSKTI